MALSVDIEKNLGSFCLNVQFEAGDETLALLGASGCGKSLTLKCIAGIEKPDRGRIVSDGIVLFDSEKKINLTPQQRRVGLMLQNYGLFPNMTVLQNIRAGAGREKDRAKRKAAVESVIERFGLAELSGRYPGQLSGGQQQRVALARILVSEPRLLLLDEPFSALDAHLRFRLERDVRQVIQKFGKTVLLVSHDRDEVFRMSDSIAIVHQGKIEALGSRKAVFADPRTENGAILTGCKNVSRIRILDDRHVEALDWGIRLQVPGMSEKYSYIGIRMHDICGKMQRRDISCSALQEEQEKSALREQAEEQKKSALQYRQEEQEKGMLREQAEENVFRCQVVEEIENPFSYTVMLKLEGSGEAAPIGWEMEKEVWRSIRHPQVEVCLPCEKILMLRR